MRISNKMKFVLFILLIILNLILRYPVIDHELGVDTLEIHILANSISTFGEARWWFHPLAIIGMYLNSYASAVPFILSGISQSIGLDVELSIFIYSLFFGLFSLFAAYILAGKIYDNDFFKFVVAFAFSISPGVLYYSTWTAPARGIFIIILPLFVYTLLKSHNHIIRFGLITFILSLLLLATHHLVFYLIPIFAAFFVVLISFRLKDQIKSVLFLTRLENVILPIRISDKLIPFALIFGFLLMLAVPFFTGRFMTVGSRYESIQIMLIEYTRYIGILIFLAFGGFSYHLFKPNKKFEEWFLVVILLFLTPFSFMMMYMKWFSLIFAFLLAGIALINLFKLSEGNYKKNVTFVIIIFLLSSVFMSGYFQYWRSYGPRVDYIKNDEYETGLWFKEVINGSGVSDPEYIGMRISAISGKPLFLGVASVSQTYGFVDVRDWELEKVPITSDEFWLNSPYKRISDSDARGYWRQLMRREYDSAVGSNFISKFNLSYVIEGRHSSSSIFINSIIYNDDTILIYDNGKIRIWYLD